MAASLILALLLTAGLFVWWRAGVRTARVEAAYPPIGEFVDVGGVPIHALVRGEGPDLVLIHGASGNLRDFLPLIARLEDRYRVIAFDRPGLGWSGRLDADYAGPFAAGAESPVAQARALAAAAGALGAERPIVLGHSYGGAVALAWGLEEPAAAIVDVSGVAMPWPGGLGFRYALTASRLGGAVVPAVIAAFATPGQVAAAVNSVLAPNDVPEGYAETVGAELILAPARWRANARQVNALRPHVVEMSARYGALALPIEIVHGRQDSSVPLDIHSTPLSETVPSAHLTVLEDTGHAPHHARPEAVVAAIDRAAERAGLR